MSTSIRIERVVLDGLELTRAERAALAPAIAAELRRLAGERAGRRAGPGPAGQGPSVEGIAREVAAAVHRALGPAVAAPAAPTPPVASMSLAAPISPAALTAPVAPAGRGRPR